MNRSCCLWMSGARPRVHGCGYLPSRNRNDLRYRVELNMRVALRGRNVSMSQCLADKIEAGAARGGGRRQRVAQRMQRHMLQVGSAAEPREKLRQTHDRPVTACGW